MYKLVLLRHGESTWNKENRFTGWTDVDLSERGIAEGKQAGISMKEAGLEFRFSYTSFLKRAIKTLNYALEEMDLMWIPVEKSWRLNEKHYGLLQGLNKTEMVNKYGEAQVLQWRRSYTVQPPVLEESDPRHPINDVRYQGINEKGCAPATEALCDTVARIVPYWESNIKINLQKYEQVLVTAHGNSLRGIIKHLKGISDDDIVSLNLPTGIPYVFEFDEKMNLVKDYFLADEATLKKLMDEVANQGKK
jgi:2,3-bisphosphoglycerate-dependent phosphoglycerate mutase